MKYFKKLNLKLSREEKEVLEGKQGETLKKVMETIVRYGEALKAKKLVKI